MKVSKGLSTYAGIVGALAGFLTALAVFMDTFDQLDPLAGLGPLAAAAGVLYKVIDGRMKQATALAANPRSTGITVTGDAGKLNRALADGASGVIRGGELSRGLGGPTPATKPGEFDGEPESPPEDELRDLHENDQT